MLACRFRSTHGMFVSFLDRRIVIGAFQNELSWVLILVSSDFTWRRIGKEEEGKNLPYLLTLSLLTRIKTQLRVPDLNVACTNRCEKVLFDCIISCGDDSNCISQCIRENGQCYNGKSPSSGWSFRPPFLTSNRKWPFFVIEKLHSSHIFVFFISHSS